MRKQQTGVWFYVPKAFDVELLPESLRRFDNEAEWFLSRIACLGYRNNDGWVPISRQTSRTYLADRIEVPMKTALKAAGVIQCDEKYHFGDDKAYAKSYRLAPEFLGQFKRVECTSPVMAEKIKRHRINVFNKVADTMNLSSTHDHLLANLKSVTIDREAALDVIAQKQREAMSEEITVERIANIKDEYDFTVDFVGRVHTPIVRLTKECRQFVRMNGEQLVNLDMANSQVVFFALIYLQSLHLNPTPYINPSSTSQPYTLPHSGDKLSESSKLFLALVMAGKIYDYLVERYNAKASRPVTRDEFKHNLFFCYVFYGKLDPWILAHPVVDVFKQEFPDVWVFILAQKQGNFRDLPRRMQEMESSFMIGEVCGRLTRDYPAVPVLTIHDSILTTAANVELVKGIILAEFARLGVCPTVKVEALG